MKPELSASPQTARKVSRLAVTSLILAALFFLLLWSATTNSEHLAIPAIGCLLLSPICGITALIVIKRSSGQLFGVGIVIAAFLSILLLFFLPGLLIHGDNFGGQHAPNRAKAAATIQSLSYTSRCYNSEYGCWPQAGNIGDLVLIFNGLRDPRTGEDVSNARPDLLKQNPRRIQFMEFRLKDVTSPSGRAKPTDALAFYDPWGMPYAFCFDNGKRGVYFVGPSQKGMPTNPQPWIDSRANDNQIPLPFSDGTFTNPIPEGFAFFSNGPDTRTGTGPSDPGGKDRAGAYEDDIRSWK